MGRTLRVEADGGSRGNPGVAGYGALVRDRATGELLVELAAPLGTASNNVAEYRGLIAGLRAAHTVDPSADIEVAMDSKLVVEQMSGRWKIKHPDMRALALEARDLLGDITAAGGSVDLTWIPREDNGDADALSNRGMDGEHVEDWHDGESAAAATVTTSHREPTRVLLVCHADPEPGPDGVARTSDRVADALGDAPVRVIASERYPGTGAAIAERLGVPSEMDPRWDGSPGVVAAWDSVVGAGGTLVIICDAASLRRVLAHVLGMPHDRAVRLALTPGSLTAIDAGSDGTAVVAFTNRT